MATTSGVAAFNLDLSEIVEEAFERAGSELRTGYDLRTARRSLNLLFADWANRGVNMWTFEQNTINLVAGQPTYALPDDTVDILDHVIRTQANQPSNQADLTITRISVSTYATIPNKLTTGRPIQVWIQRLTANTAPTSATTTGGTTAANATTIQVSTLAGRDQQPPGRSTVLLVQLLPGPRRHHGGFNPFWYGHQTDPEAVNYGLAYA